MSDLGVRIGRIRTWVGLPFGLGTGTGTGTGTGSVVEVDIGVAHRPARSLGWLLQPGYLLPVLGTPKGMPPFSSGAPALLAA